MRDLDGKGNSVYRMHWTKRRTIAAGLFTGVLLAGIGVLGFMTALPRVANHYSFALPGKDGLPYYLHYNGRRYATQGMCAHASWCAGQARACEAPADIQRELQAHGQWPLREVGRVHTLPLGPSYPMLAATTPAGMTTIVLYVPYQGCYQVYGLEGGP